ncbi:hypothetical protein Tco_1457164 [Tanacetum coccineum]
MSETGTYSLPRPNWHSGKPNNQEKQDLEETKHQRNQKNLLKQQFETFTIGSREELDSAYERFQHILSMLELHDATVSIEDANLKFLRSLPSVWHVVATMIRGQPGLDDLALMISTTHKVTLKQSTAEPAHIPKGYTQAISSKVPTAPNCVSHSDEIIYDDFDWSNKADDAPVSLALMATNSEVPYCSKLTFSSGDETLTDSTYENFKREKAYKAVPPPTGTIIPPRINVSFTGIDELAIRNKVVNQEKTKSSQSQLNRNKVIIEDWVDSDDEETNVSESQKETALTQRIVKLFFENGRPNILIILLKTAIYMKEPSNTPKLINLREHRVQGKQDQAIQKKISRTMLTLTVEALEATEDEAVLKAQKTGACQLQKYQQVSIQQKKVLLVVTDDWQANSLGVFLGYKEETYGNAQDLIVVLENRLRHKGRPQVLDDQQSCSYHSQCLQRYVLLQKKLNLSSEDQALHYELVSLMHQESLAKAHNDDQRIAFEEEKRRISIAKGKEHIDSTFTLSTANTPPQKETKKVFSSLSQDEKLVEAISKNSSITSYKMYVLCDQPEGKR